MSDKFEEPNDLNNLEKKSFEDGLMDMLISFLFISLVIGQFGTLLGDPDILYFLIFYGLSYVIGLACVAFLKRYFVIPRTGKEKASLKGKRRKKWLALILIFFSFVILIFYLENLPEFPIQISFPPLQGISLMLLIGVIFIFIPMALVAYFINFPRLYIVAFLGFIAIVLIENLNETFEGPYQFIIVLGIVGLIILSWSIIIFYRFLKRHPRQKINKNSEV